MPLRQLVEIIQHHKEIALCERGAGVQAHRGLYELPEGAYFTLVGEPDPFVALNELVGKCAVDPACSGFRMHVALQWTTLLQVASGCPTLTWSDIYLLLKDTGVEPAEMMPFRDSSPDDLYPWLFYGKRLDVFRRICVRAKKKLDDKLSLHDIRVMCHLVAEDSPRIVASSL